MIEKETESYSVAEVQKLVNRLTLLLEVNASINSTINLSDLLRKILSVAAMVMQAEASSLALIDPVTNELVFQFAHGEAGQIVETIRLPMGEGIAGWVAKYGVPLVIPDAQNDPRFYKGVDSKTDFITRSVICVPLKRNDRIIGVLEALNKQDNGVFIDEDLIIFESLANIATIAIENSQLYQLLSQKVMQLEITNKRLESILNKLESSEKEIKALQEAVSKGIFSGSLDTFRIENLLQMLANEQKTGKLNILSENNHGLVYFNSGKLEHAEIINKSFLKGADALYEMITWQGGKFSFEQEEKSPEGTINVSLMHLIIEALRRLDEFNVLKEKYPFDKKPKISISDQAKFKPDTFNTNQVNLLKLLNGEKTIKEIFEIIQFDRYTILNDIKELDKMGIITFS